MCGSPEVHSVSFSPFHGEQNETASFIFVLVIELISWDKKQAKRHNDLKK